MNQAANLVAALREYRPGPGVFNPWRDWHPDFDVSDEAPRIRSANLEAFLRARLNRARYLLLGEAVSYQGGRFTGIAMTSERILLGHHAVVKSAWIMPEGEPRRSSRPDVKPPGFNEPTATIVWGSLIHEMGLSPVDFITWNTFPFHPFQPKEGHMTNRTPTDAELRDGVPFLQQLLEAQPGLTIIAVGKKAEGRLAGLGLTFHTVRHPANGGANTFRSNIRELLG